MAAAGKQFAIVRVGSSNSGGLYVDPYFLQNVNGAKAAGLRVGAYYYTYARTRAAAMIADAEKQVKLAVGGIQEQTAFEEKRLETAKAATAKFIDAARAICNTQLKNIETVANGILPQSAEAKPAVSVDDTVRSIENSASRIQADPSIQIDIPPVKTAPAAPTAPARQRKLDSTQPFSL